MLGIIRLLSRGWFQSRCWVRETWLIPAVSFTSCSWADSPGQSLGTSTWKRQGSISSKLITYIHVIHVCLWLISENIETCMLHMFLFYQTSLFIMSLYPEVLNNTIFIYGFFFYRNWCSKQYNDIYLCFLIWLRNLLFFLFSVCWTLCPSPPRTALWSWPCPVWTTVGMVTPAQCWQRPYVLPPR